MRPDFVFFPFESDIFSGEAVIGDNFFLENECHTALIRITDDTVSEAEQMFIVRINVAPELESLITMTTHVSIVHIMDNDGK